MVILPNGRKYLTVNEAVHEWEVARKEILGLCRSNLIPDAIKDDHNRWLIPADNGKPVTKEQIAAVLLLSQLMNCRDTEIKAYIIPGCEDRVIKIYKDMERTGFMTLAYCPDWQKIINVAKVSVNGLVWLISVIQFFKSHGEFDLNKLKLILEGIGIAIEIGMLEYINGGVE